MHLARFVVADVEDSVPKLGGVEEHPVTTFSPTMQNSALLLSLSLSLTISLLLLLLLLLPSPWTALSLSFSFLFRCTMLVLVVLVFVFLSDRLVCSKKVHVLLLLMLIDVWMDGGKCFYRDDGSSDRM